MKKWLPFLLTLLILQTQHGLAQTNATTMADQMRSEGRIYVVLTVMLTILGGLIIYLIKLDKKITAIEKNKDA
jgi:hypothetical protein